LLRQKKVTEEKATPVRRPLHGFPPLLNQTGLLINSHDLLRSHVLKHIRRITPVWSALLGGAQGKVSQRRQGGFVCASRTIVSLREAGNARLTGVEVWVSGFDFHSLL